MYKFLVKNGQLVAFGVGLFLVVVFYLIAASGIGEFSSLPKEERGASNLFNFGLMAAFALVIICALVMLAFGVYQMATNPKSAKKGLIGLGALAVLFMALYAMASTDASGGLAAVLEKFNISEGVHKYVSAAISTTGVLGILAVLAFVYSEVRNLIK